MLERCQHSETDLSGVEVTLKERPRARIAEQLLQCRPGRLTRRVGAHMRFRSALFAALATLPGAGCLVESGCGYESRQVEARAQISSPADPRVEYADLLLSQTHGDASFSPAREIAWLVIGVDLYAHVQGARLIDARDGGGTLLELPKQPIVGGTAVLAGSLSDTPGPEAFNRLYDLLVTGRVAIELDSDLPGRERIRQVFQVTSGGRAWSEPSCS
jgi:hypothetical protein